MTIKEKKEYIAEITEIARKEIFEWGWVGAATEENTALLGAVNGTAAAKIKVKTFNLVEFYEANEIEVPKKNKALVKHLKNATIIRRFK